MQNEKSREILSMHKFFDFNTMLKRKHRRLVKNIRQLDNESSSSNLLAKEWDFNIEEREAEFKEDLRAASGIGKRRKVTTF